MRLVHTLQTVNVENRLEKYDHSVTYFLTCRRKTGFHSKIFLSYYFGPFRQQVVAEHCVLVERGDADR